MRKLVLIIFLVVLSWLFFGRKYFDQKPINIKTAENIQQKESTNNSIQEPIEVSGPEKLLIPKLKIEASVESVGMDSQGRMDVPKDVDNVAWYNLGYKPGEGGSAVISGHFDTASGGPAVFYYLNKLAVGDEITTVDSDSNEITFIVYDIRTFPYDQLPLKEIFASSGESQLNLITCSGNWDTNNKNYSNRTVVYSRLKQ